MVMAQNVFGDVGEIRQLRMITRLASDRLRALPDFGYSGQHCGRLLQGLRSRDGGTGRPRTLGGS